MQADVTLEKSLPHNTDAERAVLGAVLIDNRLFDQAAELLSRDDFYLESHRRIFGRMEYLSSLSRPIDSLTLGEELQRENELEGVGGLSYVASLLDGVPRVSNIEQYARIVKEKALLRRLIHSANEILIRGFSSEENADVLLEHAERSIFEIGQEKLRSGFQALHDLLPFTWNQIEAASHKKELVTGVPTGFIDLDGMLSGLQKSDLIIVAARPGLGKTSLALNIGQHAALKHQKVIGIFSLEMSSHQLVNRMLCAEARVDSHRVRAGLLNKEEWGSLARASSSLSKARIYIDDSPGISIVEVRSKARRLKVEQGLDLLVVDYLQLMSGTSGGGRIRYENRQQEISAISRSLKALAKELDVPLIAISQLSRAPEQRKGESQGRPQLSDLRESGSIEQDADVVLFIYRPSMYKREEESMEDEGTAEIIIGKHRNGPTGSVHLAFIDKWTKFGNLERSFE
jgi:replicative DNA helicase